MSSCNHSHENCSPRSGNSERRGIFGAQAFYCYSLKESIRFACKSSQVFWEPELSGYPYNYTDLWIFLKQCLWIMKTKDPKRRRERKAERRTGLTEPISEQQPGVISFSRACNLLFAAWLPRSEMVFVTLCVEEATNPQIAPWHHLFKGKLSLDVKPDSRNEESRPGWWVPKEKNVR